MNDEYSRNASCPKYSSTFMTLLLPKVVILHFCMNESYRESYVMSHTDHLPDIHRYIAKMPYSSEITAFQHKPQNVKNTCCETIKTIKYC